MRLSNREADVLKACGELLTAARVLWWRSNNTGIYDPTRKRFRSFSGRRGVADIIAVLTMKGILSGGIYWHHRVGVLLAIECKSTTGRQSPEQQQFQREVEAAGGIYLLCRDVRELEALLRKELFMTFDASTS